MTSPSNPSGEQLSQMEPDTDSVVTREDDEGLIIEAHIITGDVVNNSKARTYTRSFGHYFINSDSEAADLFDDLISEFTAEHSILTNFQRQRDNAYEIIVESAELKEKDAQFNGLTEAKLELPSHSEYIDQVDSFLDEVRTDVKDT